MCALQESCNTYPFCENLRGCEVAPVAYAGKGRTRSQPDLICQFFKEQTQLLYVWLDAAVFCLKQLISMFQEREGQSERPTLFGLELGEGLFKCPL